MAERIGIVMTPFHRLHDWMFLICNLGMNNSSIIGSKLFQQSSRRLILVIKKFLLVNKYMCDRTYNIHIMTSNNLI